MDHPLSVTKAGKEATFDHVKEFSALRSEILAAIKEERALERYTLVTTGGIWAWLAGHHVTARLPWGIPIALVLVASLRAANLMYHLGTLGRYIRTQLEPDGKGYETFLYRERNNSSVSKQVVRTLSDYGSWVALLLLSGIALLLGPSLKVPVLPPH